MEKNILKRFFRVFFLIVFNLFLSRSTRYNTLKRFILRLAFIKIGPTTTVVGPLIVGKAVILHIGNGSWLGQDFKIYGSGKVIIGNRVAVGPDVTILSGSHAIGNQEQRAGKGLHFTTII